MKGNRACERINIQSDCSVRHQRLCQISLVSKMDVSVGQSLPKKAHIFLHLLTTLSILLD